MTENCHIVLKNMERWLELNAQEKDAVKAHIKGCSNCMAAWASIDPVLQALNQSAKAYDQIKYAGPMPAQPEQKLSLAELWLFVPKAGWATALAVMIGVGVWFGLKSPVTREVAEGPATLGALRMPSMPSLGQEAISLAMSPGTLGIPTPRPQIGSSLKRHIQIPNKPEAPDRDPQKRTSMRQQYHVKTS